MKAQDLESDAITNEDTYKILSGMHKDGELVLTTSTSYVPSSRVHGIASVSVFQARDVTASPILPGQYFRRADVLFA